MVEITQNTVTYVAPLRNNRKVGSHEANQVHYELPQNNARHTAIRPRESKKWGGGGGGLVAGFFGYPTS